MKSKIPVERKTPEDKPSSKGSFTNPAASLRSPQAESIIVPRILAGRDVQLIKEQEQHDLKNLFSGLKQSSMDCKARVLDPLLDDDVRRPLLPEIEAKYALFCENIERMGAINRSSIDAFTLIVEGNLDDAAINEMLSAHAENGEAILGHFHERIGAHPASPSDAYLRSIQSELGEQLDSHFFSQAVRSLRHDFGCADLPALCLGILEDLRRPEGLWPGIGDADPKLQEFRELASSLKKLVRVLSIKSRLGGDPADVLVRNGHSILGCADEQLRAISQIIGALPAQDPLAIELLRLKAGMFNQKEEMLRSLASVHSFSKSGQYAVNLQQTDLIALSANVVRKALVKKPGILSIVWEGALADPPRSRHSFVKELDPLLMDYALINVVSNALKYAKEEIRVGIRADRKSIRIWVRDDGIGMTEEEASRAFVRGVKNENATEDSTGFGLNFAQETAKLFDARIEIADPGPRGGGEQTTFLITIKRG